MFSENTLAGMLKINEKKAEMEAGRLVGGWEGSLTAWFLAEAEKK